MGLVRRCVLGYWGRWGSTFRAGQRLLAQGAETEALIETAGSGLFQHPWAPIHPMQLEEAPSLQLGWELKSQLIPATSQLGPCTPEGSRPCGDVAQVFGTSESMG